MSRAKSNTKLRDRACNDLSYNFFCTSPRRREIQVAENDVPENKDVTGQVGTPFVCVSSLVLRGDQIGTENLFQPSKQTRVLVWFSSRKENIASRADKSDWVYSSCGRKMKTLFQLYSFVSSVLLSSKNEKSESEEGFKRPVQALPSNVGFFTRLNSTGYENSWNTYLTV